MLQYLQLKKTKYELEKKRKEGERKQAVESEMRLSKNKFLVCRGANQLMNT